MAKFKINDRVNTIYGSGTIVDYELIRNIKRWGVALDKNPFDFSPAYFWEDEIELIN